MSKLKVWVIGDDRGYCRKALLDNPEVHLDQTPLPIMKKSALRSYKPMIDNDLIILLPPRGEIKTKADSTKVEVMLNVLGIQSKKKNGHYCLLNSPSTPFWKLPRVEELASSSTQFVRWCGFGIQDDQTKLNTSKTYKLISNIPWLSDPNTCCGERSHTTGKLGNVGYTLFYDKFLCQVVSALRQAQSSPSELGQARSAPPRASPPAEESRSRPEWTSNDATHRSGFPNSNPPIAPSTVNASSDTHLGVPTHERMRVLSSFPCHPTRRVRAI